MEKEQIDSQRRKTLSEDIIELLKTDHNFLIQVQQWICPGGNIQ